MAKKKKKHYKRKHGAPQQASRQQAAPRQGSSWLTRQLELINRIQPKVAEAAERERRARERQAEQGAE
ncbi:hypothetical protein [Acetatifactor aquisgranensis]|uniref:hypothetical protein n=1 Tax=Acetatifactor aquisgranensis TaxID=2941233 RepID=UPI00203FB25D|nr:hypothetical protein [Acetatifactor aquisgranensis]